MNDFIRVLAVLAFLIVSATAGFLIIQQLDTEQAPVDTAAGDSTGCANFGESCEDAACCGNGVCQGISGSRVCEDPGTDDQCPGGTCTAYISFKCNVLSDFKEENGELKCELNPVDGQNLAHINGCGQLDQVCAGGERANQLCGGFSVFTNNCGTDTPPPPSPDPECGDSCTNNDECPDDHQCVNGICRKNSCIGSNCTPDPNCGSPEVTVVQSECGGACAVITDCVVGNICQKGICIKRECVNNVCGPSPICGNPINCGDACANNGRCPDDHTCQAGTCVLDFCLTPGNCNDSCTPANCGDGVISAGEECEVGNTGTCAEGSTCNTSTCQCDPTDCGSSCTVNTDCPDDHTCQAGTCVLTECLNNPEECEPNLCKAVGTITPPRNLPRTAIFGDSRDNLFFAFLVILLAAITYRLGIWERLIVNLASMPEFIRNNQLEKFKSELERKTKR